MKRAPFFKDWEEEKDLDVKAQNKAEGKYGMQFNISMLQRMAAGDRNPKWRTGDRTVDISSMEPFNQLITTASLIAEGKGVVPAFWQSAHDSLNDLPSLQTLANIENTIRYTDTPDEGWKTAGSVIGSTAGSVASGFIPAPVRHATVAADSKARDTTGNNAFDRSVKQAMASLPWLRQMLPEKTDAYGNSVEAGDLPTRLLTQYGAFKYSQVNQTKESAEVNALMEATGEKLVPSRNGPSSVTFGSGKSKETVKLTAEERREYKNEAGKTYEKAIRKTMQSDVYKHADEETRAEMLKSLLNYSKDTAKDDLADERDIEYSSDYDPIRKLKDPFGYLNTKTAYTEATRDGEEDWKAVDQLMKDAKKLDDGTRAYAREHVSGFKTLYDIMEEGLSSSKVYDQFSTGSKDRANKRGSTSASGADILAEIGEGKYSKKDADILMGRKKADGSYYAGKGRHAAYQAMRESGYSPKQAQEFWEALDANGNGTVTKKELNAALKTLSGDYRNTVRDAFWRIYNES